MRTLEAVIPERLDEAVSFLARLGPRAKAIAGGTDLVVEMKEDKRSPGVLVDISRLSEPRGIRVEGDAVWVGALATHAEVAGSPLVRSAAPLLAEACGQIGSPQIRARGTIGGNLCTASPAGDCIPPLFVLEASVEVVGQGKTRTCDVESFFVGPKRSSLAPDEIVLGVRFPALGADHVSFFRKLGQRKSLAISVVSVAFVARRVRPGVFEDVRVALGAVAPTVVRARTVEKALGGKRLDIETARHVSKLAFRDCVPITDIRGSQGYRQEMACNLLYEGLVDLL